MLLKSLRVGVFSILKACFSVKFSQTMYARYIYGEILGQKTAEGRLDVHLILLII